jgi:hypothetical protein
MRRFLSLALLLVFSLPLLAPMLALAQADPDASLPMCCRRHGAHHCAMQMARTTNAPAASAPCPMYPQHATAPAIGNLFAITAPVATTTTAHAMLTPTARAQASHRIARERSRHKRGPPTQLL